MRRYAGNLDHVLRQETVVTNLPALLHYEDRNSMHFSIEARVPFLDYRVVEYIASLPLDQKLRRGVTKRVLRRAIRGIVPETIRCRMDKMGFVTPEEVWMGRELAPFVEEVFASASFRSRPYLGRGRGRGGLRAIPGRQGRILVGGLPDLRDRALAPPLLRRSREDTRNEGVLRS